MTRKGHQYWQPRPRGQSGGATPGRRIACGVSAGRTGGWRPTGDSSDAEVGCGTSGGRRPQAEWADDGVEWYGDVRGATSGRSSQQR